MSAACARVVLVAWALCLTAFGSEMKPLMHAYAVIATAWVAESCDHFHASNLLNTACRAALSVGHFIWAPGLWRVAGTLLAGTHVLQQLCSG